MIKVLIACPTYKREWILPTWLKAIENQSIGLENIGFLFELGPEEKDPATHEILWEWQSRHPEVSFFDAQCQLDLDHCTHEEKAQEIAAKENETFDINGPSRVWSEADYYRMVRLRNSLLERAYGLEYEHYFSLDTDIILEDPHTIRKLAEFNSLPGVSLVSPLCYMTPFDTNYPNVMTWVNKDMPRWRALRVPAVYPDPIDSAELFEVDIVMAAVMMKPEVTREVTYMWHTQGEDLGFARNLAETEYRSFCAPRIYAPHIMYRLMLDDYLKYDKLDARRPAGLSYIN